MATASIKSTLMSLLRFGSDRVRNNIMVFPTFPGERHEIGTLMAAVCAQNTGARVLYLGPDLPKSHRMARDDKTRCPKNRTNESALLMSDRADDHVCCPAASGSGSEGGDGQTWKHHPESGVSALSKSLGNRSFGAYLSVPTNDRDRPWNRSPNTRWNRFMC